MEALKPAEVKSIEQFFQFRQESLLKVMYRFLKSKYKTVYCTKSYVIAVGDIPVALTAHLDTVFSTPPKNIFYDRVKNVMWSPEGLGADDRAGVYSIVQIIKQGLKPSIIFTTDEEKGALGALEITKRFPKPPMDLKYIIELDRRGSVDCVFYDCDNPKFEKYIENFGFVTAWGSFSDISIICPTWEIAGVNLSIGYEDEHSHQELLYIGHMQSTIKKVISMLKSVNNKTEKFKYIPLEYQRYYTHIYDDYDWNPAYGVSKEQWLAWHTNVDLLPCNSCGVKDFDYNLFPTKALDGSTIFLCSDCISQDPNIYWCNDCGEPFMARPEEQNVKYCYDCRKKGDNNTNGLSKN